MNAPWPVFGDAYTVSGQAIASPDAKRTSVYNLTNRIGPMNAWPEIAQDNRMVMYGLSDYVSKFLNNSLTQTELMDSLEFMLSAHSYGGELNFHNDAYRLWRRVIKEFHGKLPLIIEGIPEGGTFWPNEPYVQVTSLGDGFGEIAAMVEATLVGMVSCATARATATRHWLDRLTEEVIIDNPGMSWLEAREDAQWMIHDFGMRASSTPMEAEIFGRAHLLSFRGTDTFNAAYSAYTSCPDTDKFRPVGTSILALAHRIVQGYDVESDAYDAIFKASDECGSVQIASYVADCYDFHTAVDKFLVPLALKCKERGKGCIVVRPDSGDYLENCLYVVKRALEYGLCSLQNGRVAATHLRFIQGDSMNPTKVKKVIHSIRKEYDVSGTGWGIFGVGGWLRRTGDRDVLSSGYKLAAKDVNKTPVVKLSDTRAKMSVPGVVDVFRPIDNSDSWGPTVYPKWTQGYEAPSNMMGIYETYYTPGGINTMPRFDRVRQFSLKDWYESSDREPSPDVLCDDIKKIQQDYMDRYNKKFLS